MALPFLPRRSHTSRASPVTHHTVVAFMMSVPHGAKHGWQQFFANLEQVLARID